ncbi:hypothetical protein GUJ93_ZPchr0013g34328 [Zizania palustris]|uniref:Ataxin-2 C-terminal domain-containing protein n=1 Tax=Zizania palustris TaxID=103762 RepID=A0A8J6C0P2_ZIZPA|nr:hypothetical protein GUJ93_ZPchr0013g34328 [Zizania palustris]
MPPNQRSAHRKSRPRITIVHAKSPSPPGTSDASHLAASPAADNPSHPYAARGDRDGCSIINAPRPLPHRAAAGHTRTHPPTRDPPEIVPRRRERPRESDRRRMSTMAMASSSLNPNAPLFIPAAFRKVEDFSPEWWELVKTTAWFRDHWFRQHQLYEEMEEQRHDDDVAALLPDDSFDLLDMVDTDDLFYNPTPGFEAHVLRTLSLNSPRGAEVREPPRHGEKPAQYAGAKGGAPRVIHQPR